LHLIDCDLEEARLLIAEGRAVEAAPIFKRACDGVNRTGYHRRDGELAALQTALGS